MRHLIIGTAGHVDHGKTALIKALTNIDCDTHKEEKERGITINLGFSHLDLPGGDSVGIVDVPGHKDFIRTMVAGAYGIDIAMLVVAADSGIMPQTEEHLRILEMLGVRHGIVVLTKSDLVDKETLELAELEITEYLEGTGLENAPVVSVSSVTGEGLNELVQTIEQIIPGVEEKESGNLFRMYIDRIFNVKGLGYVVTGSVLEGSVKTGQDLYLLPGKSKKVKVRNIERHGVAVDAVFHGDRAALNLAGLKFEDYTRGMVLCNKQLDDTRLIDATIKVFDPASALPVWSSVLFISGTFETAARLHLLNADELLQGDTGLVQVHLEKPAVLAARDKFIIRNSSNNVTIGGGAIIDVNPLHHRKRTEKLIRELEDLLEAQLHSDNIISLVRLALSKANGPTLASDVANSLESDTASLVKEIEQEGKGKILVFKAGGLDILITPETDRDYQEQVLEELRAYHNKYPILEDGLGTNEFIGKFGFGKSEAGKLYLEGLMDRIAAKGLIRKVGNSYALHDHKVSLDPKTTEELEWIEKMYRQEGMDVPNTKDIEERIHDRRMNKEKYKMLLKYLAEKGRLAYHDGIFVHQDIVEEAQNKLLAKIAVKEDGINEKEFRELIGGTRKFIQLMLGILTERGCITKPTFYILITDKGRKIIENSNK